MEEGEEEEDEDSVYTMYDGIKVPAAKSLLRLMMVRKQLFQQTVTPSAFAGVCERITGTTYESYVQQLKTRLSSLRRRKFHATGDDYVFAAMHVVDASPRRNGAAKSSEDRLVAFVPYARCRNNVVFLEPVINGKYRSFIASSCCVVDSTDFCSITIWNCGRVRVARCQDGHDFLKHESSHRHRQDHARRIRHALRQTIFPISKTITCPSAVTTCAIAPWIRPPRQ